jgi:hypothetical protein
VFYESGLSINVMYSIDDAKKRAVGFKLSEGMEIPAELASRFKFARQKSKLAGNHPGLLLRDQRRVLTSTAGSAGEGSGKTGCQDPHELRRRLRPWAERCQVVLDGRRRQPEAVRGGLLRAGDEDRRHDQDLSVSGASGGAAGSHASRVAAASHSSRPSIAIS